jgi:hypothetical protein
MTAVIGGGITKPEHGTIFAFPTCLWCPAFADGIDAIEILPRPRGVYSGTPQRLLRHALAPNRASPGVLHWGRGVVARCLEALRAIGTKDFRELPLPRAGPRFGASGQAGLLSRGGEQSHERH